jgi:hypothetical protein
MPHCLLLRHLPRSNRHLLAMSPEPSNATVKYATFGTKKSFVRDVPRIDAGPLEHVISHFCFLDT